MKCFLKGTLLCALVATTTFAGENRSGFYFGGGVGNANYSDNGLSLVIGDAEIEKSADGIKGYLGYQFNNVVGLELGYADYGKYKSTRVGSDYSYAAQSYSVAANLGYSFLDSQLRPFVNLGLGYVQTKHENLYPLYKSIKDAAVSLHYGVGIQYEPNILRGLGFRIAYEADTYMTAIETYGSSSFDDTYTQTSSLVYAAVQYKF
jgi:hypothetical protein